MNKFLITILLLISTNLVFADKYTITINAEFNDKNAANEAKSYLIGKSSLTWNQTRNKSYVAIEENKSSGTYSFNSKSIIKLEKDRNEVENKIKAWLSDNEAYILWYEIIIDNCTHDIRPAKPSMRIRKIYKINK